MISGFLSSASRKVITSGDNLTVDSDALFASSSANNIAIGLNALNSTDADADNNIAIGVSALTSLTGGDENVAVGSEAMNNLTGGGANTCIGHTAGRNIAGGDNNVCVGRQAGYALTAASSTVLIGYNAGDSINVVGASGTIAIGASALAAVTSAASNTAVGHQAGLGLIDGNDNTIIGYDALTLASTATNNVAIGKSAMRDVKVGVAVDGCIAIGKAALLGNSSNTTGIDATIAIGRSALTALTTGTRNTAIGYSSMSTAQTGANNTMLGYNTGFRMLEGSDFNTVIGSSAFSGLHADTQSDSNVAVGYLALNGALVGVTGAVAVGASALTALTAGAGNTAVGYQAGLKTTGVQNTLLGYQAGLNLNEGGRNTVVGFAAFSGTLDANGDESFDNTFIGSASGSGTWTAGSSNKNTAVGSQTMIGDMDDAAENTAIGYGALTDLTTGGDNTAIGYNAGANITDGHDNVIIGQQAGDVTTSVGFSVIIGASACGTGDLTAAADGTVAIGNQALKPLTSGANNIAIGNLSGLSTTTGGNNTFTGRQSGLYNVSGDDNTYIGQNAGAQSYVDSDNTYIGSDAGSVTHGGNNVAVGKDALKGLTFTDGTCDYDDDPTIGHEVNAAIIAGLGVSGTGIPVGAYIDSITSGTEFELSASTTGGAVVNGSLTFYSRASGTTAIGYQALISLTTGASNVAIGKDAGEFVTTASGSCFVGKQAGQGITGTKLIGDNNTAIGKESGVLLQGTAHSNTFVGGTAGNVATTAVANTCIGYNTDIEDATATNQVVIGNNCTGTADNAVHIGNASNILYTAFSSDSWSATSDIRQKKNIQDDTLGLEFINSLRTTTYSHKSPSEFPEEWTSYNPDDKEPMDGDRVFHSLIAQEVKQSLDDIGCKTFDGWSVDPDGRQRVARTSFVTPLIKAVQELSAQVEELKNK